MDSASVPAFTDSIPHQGTPFSFILLKTLIENLKSAILCSASAIATSQGPISVRFARELSWFSLYEILLLTNDLDWSNILDMDSSSNKFRSEITEAWRSLTAFETIRNMVDEKIADYRDLIRANANF